MKLWLKILIGAALGAALAAAVPAGNSAAQEALAFCASLAARIGRVTALPLVFTGALSAVAALRENRAALKTAARAAAVAAASSVFLALFGAVISLAVPLPRIPIELQTADTAPSLNLKEAVTALVPYSPAAALADGAYLLPAFVLACFIGAACGADKIKAKPVTAFFDALHGVFLQCAALIMRILPVCVIPLAALWAQSLSAAARTDALRALVIALGAASAAVIFGLYPLIFAIVFRTRRPYRALFGGLAAVLGALVSGDANFTLPLLIRLGGDNLGVRRQVNAFAFPLFSIFARGGAALALTVSFSVLLRSYTPLEASLFGVLKAAALALGLSFLLGPFPAGGAFTALGVMCAVYGKGYEAVYLLLRPASAILCAWAAALDAATALFGVYGVALAAQAAEHRDERGFV